MLLFGALWRTSSLTGSVSVLPSLLLSFIASQHSRDPLNRIYTYHGGCTNEEDV